MKFFTLAFATERSVPARKEALQARRTAVYSGPRLIGDEQFLRPLFDGSIQVRNSQFWETVTTGMIHVVEGGTVTVAMVPGATALTRMPWSASASAITRVSWLMAPLLAL